MTLALLFLPPVLAVLIDVLLLILGGYTWTISSRVRGIIRTGGPGAFLLGLALGGYWGLLIGGLIVHFGFCGY